MKRGTYQAFALILVLIPVFLLASCSDHNRRSARESREAPYLGVRVKNLSTGYLKSIDQKYGVKITRIYEESPAEEAGLQEDDILLTFDGKSLEDRETLVELVNDADIGETVEISFLHEGNAQSKSVKIGSHEVSRRYVWSNRWDDDRERTKQAWLGVSTEALTPQLRNYFSVPEDRGVLIKSVIEDSPAEAAGLKAGDVIIGVEGTDIDNHRRLVKKIRRYEPGEEIKVLIIRDGKEETLSVKLEESPRLRHRYFSQLDDIQVEIPDIDIDLPHIDHAEMEDLKWDIREDLKGAREELREAMEEMREEMHHIKIEIDDEDAGAI